MLKYTLVENPLTPALNDYIAHPVKVRTHELQDIFQRINARRPGLTMSQIFSVTNELIEEICTIIGDGEAINTPLINTLFSLSGMYEGATDSFDPKRHSLKLNVYPGTRLREVLRKVKLEKTVAAEPLPHIIEVKDMVSGAVNERLTPGGVVRLGGGRLKILEKEETNGVFIVDEHGTEIKLSMIVENKPTNIIAVIPADVAPGVYFMEVRTSDNRGSKPLRTLKTGRFYKELIV
jgi:hypothetical protein